MRFLSETCEDYTERTKTLTDLRFIFLHAPRQGLSKEPKNAAFGLTIVEIRVFPASKATTVTKGRPEPRLPVDRTVVAGHRKKIEPTLTKRRPPSTSKCIPGPTHEVRGSTSSTLSPAVHTTREERQRQARRGMS